MDEEADRQGLDSDGNPRSDMDSWDTKASLKTDSEEEDQKRGKKFINTTNKKHRK